MRGNLNPLVDGALDRAVRLVGLPLTMLSIEVAPKDLAN